MDGRETKVGLHVISVLISFLLVGGCVSDFRSSSDHGTHIRLTNMSSYVIEFNLTDKYEYNFGNITSSTGGVWTGPFDCRNHFNYTRYNLDISDKADKNRKVTIAITCLYQPTFYDDISGFHIQDSLKDVSFSNYPGRGYLSYDSYDSGRYEWLIRMGKGDEGFDASCWLDEEKALTVSTFNFNHEDSILIINSMKTSPTE